MAQGPSEKAAERGGGGGGGIGTPITQPSRARVDGLSSNGIAGGDVRAVRGFSRSRGAPARRGAVRRMAGAVHGGMLATGSRASRTRPVRMTLFRSYMTIGGCSRPASAGWRSANLFAGAAIPDEPDRDQCEPCGCGRVTGGLAVVRSKFVLIEYRREQQRLFGGTYFHRLVVLDGAIRIAMKRVDLVNCDAPMDGLTQPF